VNQAFVCDSAGYCGSKVSHEVQVGCSHLSAPSRLEVLLAGQCQLLSGGSVPLFVLSWEPLCVLKTGLNSFPRETKAVLAVTPSSMATMTYVLKWVTKSGSRSKEGELLSASWTEKFQRICRHILKSKQLIFKSKQKIKYTWNQTILFLYLYLKAIYIYFNVS
jgi:hypothetical protein